MGSRGDRHGNTESHCCNSPGRWPTLRRVTDRRVTYRALLEAGLSPRQVDHWSRQGLLRTWDPMPGYGHPRVWLDGELEVAEQMAPMVAAGVSPEAAERAARNGGWVSPRVLVLLVPAEFALATETAEEVGAA